MLEVMKVIRYIVAVGAGLMITTVAGTFICLNMTPIILDSCVQINQSAANLLFQGHGLIPKLIGVSSGAFIYYLTGKWNNN